MKYTLVFNRMANFFLILNYNLKLSLAYTMGKYFLEVYDSYYSNHR